MAVDVNSNPIELTAQGDAYADKIFVTTIQCITVAASGEFHLLDESGGRTVARVMAINANDQAQLEVNGWLRGLYVQQLPAGGKIYVHYR